MPVDDAALVYRDEKGSELNFPEMDNRIRALADAHDSLEETVLLAINADGTLKSAKVGYAADTGASDAYSVTITGSYANLDALLGVVIVVKANTTNQGEATLAVNGFAATVVKKQHGLTLDDADIVATKAAAFLYNGTSFQLLNPRSSAQSNYGADAGSANAYKIEFADLPALAASKFQMPTALYAGYRVSFKAANDNTTTSTLEVKIVSPSTSLTGTIKRKGTTDVIASDIRTGYVYDAVYDGTNWILLNPSNSPQYYAQVDSTTGATGDLSNAVHVVPHTLGARPSRVEVVVVNTSTELGYSVDDEVELYGFRNTGSNNGITAFCRDATNVTVLFGANTLEIPNKGTGTFAAIDETKWKVRVRAWL